MNATRGGAARGGIGGQGTTADSSGSSAEGCSPRCCRSLQQARLTFPDGSLHRHDDPGMDRRVPCLLLQEWSAALVPEEDGRKGRALRQGRRGAEHWELSECLKEYLADKNPSERANLQFLVGLRHKIEHRHLPESTPRSTESARPP